MADKYDEYLESFRKQRELTESRWNELIKKKTSSLFDNLVWANEDGWFWCFNAKKYTLSKALEIVRPSIIKATEKTFGEYNHVAKSFVRHRCGTGEDGPVCSWWFGDNEYGYHAVPVWMFTWEEEYDSIEEALAKEQKHGR